MYKLTDKDIWQGRIDANNESLRYHQAVQLKPIDSLTKQTTKAFSIIGFQSDEGVQRNQGRPGAAKGPREIRKQLATLPLTIGNDVPVVDIGNIRCLNNDLEGAQTLLGHTVATTLKNNFHPIILGGGHETFYGHYLGVREAVGETDTIGLVNIDAHFDLRTDDTPSSGTMFQQILSEDSKTSYLCLGIQELGNTEALFKEAERHSCTYVYAEHVLNDQTFTLIDQFAKKHDHLIVTLCMDVVVSTAAPGVSAPAPFGLDPKTVRKLLRHIVSQPNTRSFDISEVNPLLDQNLQTSRLAAYLVADVMQTFVKQHNE
ncbi:MAG TPA: formimidoylglutamase [Bacillota bacterium]|nr:formimidoylglutamase [Bacillota bacterium]